MKLRVLSIMAALAGSLQATFYYVDHTNPTPGGGTSWATAFSNLQDALAVAVASDAIRVAAGTYYPDMGGSAVNNNRDSTFQLINGVTLLGGYPNGGGGRDYAANVTILSGDLDGNDVGGVPSGMNAYTVVTGSGTDATAIVNGFTITGGLANAGDPEAFDGPRRAGGGMFNLGGSPTIRNSVIAANSAGFGGGVFNESASGFGAPKSNPSFINCAIFGNFASAYGGGINNREGCSPSFISCTITGNAALLDGGGITNYGADSALTNCIVWSNSANGTTSSPVSSVKEDVTKNVIFSYSLVENFNPGGTNLNGTLPANNPLFLSSPDPASAPSSVADLRLGTGSPALDAGDNSANELPLDLASAMRIQNTTMDLGAFEGAFAPTLEPVLYVDHGVTTPGNGTSWMDAFATLQDALAVAVFGQEIHVATGTYYPDEGAGVVDNDRNASFHLKTGVRILGGFPAGGGIRNVGTNPTILSGDIRKSGALTPSVNNSYTIVNGSAVDGTAVLDGFIVQGGRADQTGVGNYLPSTSGGGLFCDSGSPTLINCAFWGNQGLNGGAVSMVTQGTPTFINCALLGNFASTDGGGCYFRDSATPLFVNCTLTQNYAGVSGGALRLSFGGATLRNSIVWFNAANQKVDTLSASFDSLGTLTCARSVTQHWNPDGDNLDGTNYVNDPFFAVATQPIIDRGANQQGYLPRLGTGSPALNVGDDSFNSQTTDLAGNPRIQGAHIDLGAYEGAVTALDSDNDGLPDSYEISHAFLIGNLAPDSDADSDSLTALQEFAFGLNPNSPNSESDLIKGVSELAVGASSQLAVSYQLNPPALEFIDFSPQRSEDLTPASWSGANVELLPSIGSAVIVRSLLPFGSLPREFLRIKISKK